MYFIDCQTNMDTINVFNLCFNILNVAK